MVDVDGAVHEGGRVTYTAHLIDSYSIAYVELHELKVIPSAPKSRLWEFSGYEFQVIEQDGRTIVDFVMSAYVLMTTHGPGDRLRIQRFFQSIGCQMPRDWKGKQPRYAVESFYREFKHG